MANNSTAIATDAMRLPVLHLVPQSFCGLPPSCSGDDVNIETLLNTPPIVRVPVYDDIGIQYGFDLQLTEGAYFILSVFLFWITIVRPTILEFARRRRE